MRGCGQHSAYLRFKRLRTDMGIQPKIFLSGLIQCLSTGVIFFTAVTLSGCQSSPDAVIEQSEPASSNKATASAEGRANLPSMSGYILEQTKGQSTNEPVSVSSPTDAQLVPGQYCFHEEADDSWLSIRLNLGENQQFSGESVGTLIHPSQGETTYQQTFTGELLSKQAVVQVTTHIADVTRSREEAWTIETDRLDMGRMAVSEAPCSEISTDF
ncbi:hypothetical protein BH23CYA1_BH23CYA1_04330 [soil metagenome]